MVSNHGDDEIFCIGELGGGPNQFGPDWGQAEGPVRRFRVGRDGADAAWPAFQPGPLDAYHGWRSHEIEVEFDLLERPAGDGALVGTYELVLSFFASHGPCPDIEVGTGGHLGTFRPEVVRRDRSEVFRQSPTAGYVSLAVVLPAAWLRPGTNVVSVGTVLGDDYRNGNDRHDGRPLSPSAGHPFYGSWFGSGITWDAVVLRRANSRSAVQVPTRLECSPRSLRGEPVLHLLRLCTALRGATGVTTTATVRVGDFVQEVALAHDGRDFGELVAAVAVPELLGPTSASVTVEGETTHHVLTPGRKWTVHLVPHVHLDLGFTDYQGKVLELHSRNLERAVQVLERDPTFRFTVDGSMIVSDFLATRGPGAAEPVINALRSGALGVNAFHSLFLAGLASLEECLRATYNTAALSSAYQVRGDIAHLTDVPSYPVSLPSVLAHLGVGAFAGIVNHARAATADSDLAHLLSPVMWEGVDGSRILSFFVDSYSQLRFMAADPQTLGGAERALDQFVERYERPDYLPSDLLVVGAHADNEDLGDGDADFAQRWNEVYAYPRMAISTLGDYFDLVRPLADQLPVWRGDGGSFWEDGVGTGAAIEATYRRAQMLLPVAESLAAVTGWAPAVSGPVPEAARGLHRQALEAAWEALLIGCEHTWTWAHWVSHPRGSQGPDQLDWKRHHVHQAWRTGTDESRRALSQLAEQVSTIGTELIVYNSLSWARDVDVEVEMATGQELLLEERRVPFETLDDMGGSRRVRLTVPDVPALGYSTLRHRSPVTVATNLLAVPSPPAGPSLPAARDRSGPVRRSARTVESDRWLVVLDGSGMVSELLHRPSGRQLLSPASPWPLACVLYATDDKPAGDWEVTPYLPPGHRRPASLEGSGPPVPGPTSLLDRRPVSPPYTPAIYPARMRSEGVVRTYDGWRVNAVGEGPSLPHVAVSVLLRDGSDTIDVVVRLHKEYRLARESVYAAFGFDLDDPVVRYDRQLGWVDPARDHSPGSCTEWFTTQYGVVLSSGPDGPAVAWSSSEAPLFSIGDVVWGRWPDTFEVGNGYLFSWLLNNNWPVNTAPAQEGPLDVRFAFTPMATFDPARASRLGREHRVPVAASWVTPLDKAGTGPRPLPAGRHALVDLGAPQTVHVTVATARDGCSLLLRVQDLTGVPQRARLRHPAGGQGAATLAYGDERPIRPIEVDNEGSFGVELGGWSVATVLVHRPGRV